MTRFLLILHLCGLGLAAAAVVGNYAVYLVTQGRPPADAPVLGRVSPKLNVFGQVGLGLLIVTGPLLMWLQWNGTPPEWTLFALKIAAVAGFTAMVILLDVTQKKAERDRDMVAAGRLPLFNRIAATLLLLIVVFSVLAFD